jgi:hypothetical protein
MANRVDMFIIEYLMMDHHNSLVHGLLLLELEFFLKKI